jgi:hypothetical protein
MALNRPGTARTGVVGHLEVPHELANLIHLLAAELEGLRLAEDCGVGLRE